MIPVEIKSGETIINDYFSAITKWNEIAHANPEDSLIIYGGESQQKRSLGSVISWKKIGNLIERIEKE